jgi:hypothetical protein
MKKIYVRVKPKSPVAVFHRCAMKFDAAWLEVIVDDATAKRLGEEQMLEVSETQPDGFEPTASDVSSLQPLIDHRDYSESELLIVGVVGTQLDTATVAILAGLFDKARVASVELAVAEAVARATELEGELAKVNEEYDRVVALSAYLAPVDQAVAAAVSTHVDEEIAQGDEALEKLKGAVEALAEGAPAEEAKPAKKAGK